MPHDVFISYACADVYVAEVLCAALEEVGLACWMAPRDVPAGGRWAGAISRAVDETRRNLVLVLSASSGRSRHVCREITLADDASLPIVPYRIDDEDIGDDLRYYVSNLHHVVAKGPLDEPALQALLGRVDAHPPRDVVSPEPLPGIASKPVLALRVSNATQLAVRKGDTWLGPVLRSFDAGTEGEIRRHGGRLAVRSGGDRLAVFGTTEGAWAAASGIQGMRGRWVGDAADEIPFEVSIGLEYGPVDGTGRTARGLGLQVADVLAGRASAGMILASEDFVMRLPAGTRARALFEAETQVTGLADPVDTFVLDWQTTTAAPMAIAALSLVHGDTVARIDAQNRQVLIGRQRGCDLRIDDRRVSRRHAYVRWTPAGVFLQDFSTYGTSVEPTGGQETTIKGDSIALGREGRLRFGVGAEGAKTAPPVAHYRAPDTD